MYDAVNVVMEGLPGSLFSHHVKQTDDNIDK